MSAEIIIVGIAAGECRGANPASQLEKPVLVTVDINSAGQRRVSCPYIQGIKGPDDTAYFCLATLPSTKAVLDRELDKALKEIPEETPDKIKRLQAISQLRQIIPACYHQDPI